MPIIIHHVIFVYSVVFLVVINHSGDPLMLFWAINKNWKPQPDGKAYRRAVCQRSAKKYRNLSLFSFLVSPQSPVIVHVESWREGDSLWSREETLRSPLFTKLLTNVPQPQSPPPPPSHKAILTKEDLAWKETDPQRPHIHARCPSADYCTSSALQEKSSGHRSATSEISLKQEVCAAFYRSIRAEKVCARVCNRLIKFFNECLKL